MNTDINKFNKIYCSELKVIIKNQMKHQNKKINRSKYFVNIMVI